ncbi:MAG: hypothetical protein K9M02_04495 [Thiohalocapsa sp.]|nr:hypothetical protein [Thiohalocapsa sp.]
MTVRRDYPRTNDQQILIYIGSAVMGRKLSQLILLFALAGTVFAANGQASIALSASAAGGDASQPLGDAAPTRWLDEVRAQRRALTQQRRAQIEARRRALDPLGTAQQDAREEAFHRRRNEIREMFEWDRQLFLNQSPWFRPLRPLPSPQPGPVPLPDTDSEHPAPKDWAPKDWNNGWYYRGW